MASGYNPAFANSDRSDNIILFQEDKYFQQIAMNYADQKFYDQG